AVSNSKLLTSFLEWNSGFAILCFHEPLLHVLAFQQISRFFFRFNLAPTTQSALSPPWVRRFHLRRIECQSCNLQRRAYARESIAARRLNQNRVPFLKSRRSKGSRRIHELTRTKMTKRPGSGSVCYRGSL